MVPFMLYSTILGRESLACLRSNSCNIDLDTVKELPAGGTVFSGVYKSLCKTVTAWGGNASVQSDIAMSLSPTATCVVEHFHVRYAFDTMGRSWSISRVMLCHVDVVGQYWSHPMGPYKAIL